uniref:UNC93-like protein 1 n=1 Tax=Kalanchoe fedtschenkoi TaxID=63787 RepID=A0A7N0VL48_KALFE
MNYNRTDAVSVNDGTYIGFMLFMALGAILSLAILHPSRVIREDGTRCSDMKYSMVSTELVEVVKLFSNPKMLLIVPAALASNFFYSYQFNNVNGALFNLRTRGFNNVFYWGAQMLGSVGIGYVMDFSFPSKRTRGFVGIGVVAVLGTAIWAGGLVEQRKYVHGPPTELLDFKDSGAKYLGPFLLYFSYGLLDAIFQSMVYWVIGALASDSQTLSRYAGFYKGVQSAGAAAAWQIDARKVAPINQLYINWGLTSISYPLLAVLVMLAATDESSKSEAVVEKEAGLNLPARPGASGDNNAGDTKSVE